MYLHVQVGHARSASANLALWGCAVYLAFLGSAGFYAYARLAHTVSGHRPAGIVVYEVIVLVAELLIFLSGAQYGLIHVRTISLMQQLMLAWRGHWMHMCELVNISFSLCSSIWSCTRNIAGKKAG